MPAVRTLRDFLPLVMPYLDGAPYITVEQALRLAAIDWCERTRAWRAILSVDLTEQGQAVVAPDYAAIHEIETAHWQGPNGEEIELRPTQYSEVEPAQIDGTAEPGTPRYITQVAPGTISVIPFSAGTLRLTLFLKPRGGPEFGDDGAGTPLHEKQNVLPEHVFIQDAEAIASGALHRVLTIPGKPWTNDRLAAFHFQQFEARADTKFRSQMTGQQRARVRSRPHSF